MKKIPRVKRPRRNIRIRTPEYEAKERHKHQKRASRRTPIITPDGLMNEVAAAKYIGRSESTLQNWRSMGKRPPDHVKRGRNIFYEKATLDEYLSKKKTE